MQIDTSTYAWHAIHEITILEPIFIAINSKVDETVYSAHAKRLDELSLTMLGKQGFEMKIKQHYKACKDRLKLTLLYNDE